MAVGMGGREYPRSHVCSTLRVLRFQHTAQGWKTLHGGGGWEARGPAGVEEKNRLNVLTAALFFFTYFAQGSDFLLMGVGFPRAKGSLSRACLL
jgi:hypothetical protein